MCCFPCLPDHTNRQIIREYRPPRQRHNRRDKCGIGRSGTPALTMMHSNQRSSTFSRSFAGGRRRSPSRGPTIPRGDTVFIRTEIASHPSAAIDAEFVSPDPFVSSPFSASLYSGGSCLPMVCWETERTANELLRRPSVRRLWPA